MMYNIDMSDENEKNLPAEPMDFAEALTTAAQLFKNQATISQDGDATLKDIELTRAKANSFLDALNNALEVTHLAEIITARPDEFKRLEELKAMNPMLASFQLAASVSQKSMEYLEYRLNLAYEDFSNLDPAEIALLQKAYSTAVDNMNKVVAGMAKLITMQRKTGGLRLGERVSASAPSIGHIRGLEEKDDGGDDKEPRPLTSEEIADLANTSKDD